MSYEINCTPAECVKLRQPHSPAALEWAKEAMAFYGCRPVKASEDALCTFVADVFAAGRISGVREERSRRAKAMAHMSPQRRELLRLLPRISEEDVFFLTCAADEVLRLTATAK